MNRLKNIHLLNAVSKTANYGRVTVGTKLAYESVKEKMCQAFKDVQSGKFAKEWINKNESGEKKLNTFVKTIERNIRKRRLAC